MIDELSNKGLSKYITIELIASLVVTAFAIGVTYSALAAGQTKANEKIEKIEVKVHRFATDISQIKIDTAVMKTEQKNMKDDIKEILNILQRSNYTHEN